MILLLIVIYLAFVGLGLQSSLLGGAWPSIYTSLQLSVAGAGYISTTISLATVAAALLSDRLTKKLGPGRITAVGITALATALFGFSCSHSLAGLIIWSIPLGMGEGLLDTCLNNYVAIHYKTRYMSWLHCTWGIGASIGPYMLSQVLSHGASWNSGYRIAGLLQCVILAVVLLTLPKWKKIPAIPSENIPEDEKSVRKNSNVGEILKIKGVGHFLFAFFAYRALEQTVNLWAASYLVMSVGVSAGAAAGFAGLFFVGITIGRGVCGFITMKLNDDQMIRLGQIFVVAGIVLLIFSDWPILSLAGLVVIGIGSSPIYPCLLHQTPEYFGKEISQTIMGLQVAAAYVGATTVPLLFGLLVEHMGRLLFPVTLAMLLVITVVMHEKLAGYRKGEKNACGFSFTQRI